MGVKKNTLQGIFFRQYWPIVGNHAYDVIVAAFETGCFNTALAETLIVMISKVDFPTSFKEFRLISLCNTL